MPPTTGGSTSGSSTSARRTTGPGSWPRASTSAIGTPSRTHTTVLAASGLQAQKQCGAGGFGGDQRDEVRPVDLEQDRHQRHDDEQRADRGGQVDPGRQPDLDQPAGPPRGGHGAAKPAAPGPSDPPGR